LFIVVAKEKRKRKILEIFTKMLDINFKIVILKQFFRQFGLIHPEGWRDQAQRNPGNRPRLGEEHGANSCP
jgi:hypothetical protein